MTNLNLNKNGYLQYLYDNVRRKICIGLGENVIYKHGNVYIIDALTPSDKQLAHL